MKKKTKKPSQNPHQVGEEFIYTDGKETMELVSIAEITPQGYILSNRVEVNEYLLRVDKRDCTLYPADERHRQMYEAYGAYFSLERTIDSLRDEMAEIDPYNLTQDQSERIINVNKKLQKAIRV